MSDWLLPALLAIAVVFAIGRLLGRQWRAPAGRRSRGWRIAVLLAAQPMMAGLLYLTLVPPLTRLPDPEVLTILTRGGMAANGQVVALPEARSRAEIEHAPDLASALRRHPGIRRLRVRGEGLEARDRETARGLALAFDPPPLPAGLVELTPPGRVAPGGTFRVSGRVEGGGSAELVDPAGARVDAAAIDGDGRFTLEGAARVPGLALFTLRTRAAGGELVSTAEVPVWTAAAPGMRVLLLGGAPGPEVKFWRRWASDAGLKSSVRVGIGAGLALGDPTPPMNVGDLSRVDLLILDERSWAGLGAGERAAVVTAARGGMGVLLRLTGPAPAGYGAAFGMPISGGAATAAVRLLGPDGKALPTLTRRVARIGARDALPLITDASGTTLATWRAMGRGRVGVWFLTNAAGLVTAGHAERYGELWSRTAATLARASTQPSPRLAPSAHLGERVALCGLEGGDTLVTPAGQAAELLLDPAAPGCAGYWPRVAGWQAVARGDASWPFYVRDAPLPGVAAAERRDATLALVRAGPASSARITSSSRPGASWPWLLGFLALATMLWWLERSRLGRPVEGS